MDYSWEGSIISLSDSCTSSASSRFSTRPSSPAATTALQQLNATSPEPLNSASPTQAVPQQQQQGQPSTTAPILAPHSPTAAPSSPPAPNSRARDSPSPARPHRRQRTSTAGSIASDAGSSHRSHSESGMTSSEEGEGEEEGGESNLLMPSMRISLARMPARLAGERERGVRGRKMGDEAKLGRARAAEGRTPCTKILLLGKTSHERQTLASMLSNGQTDHQQDEREREREPSIAATDDGASEGCFGGDHEHMSASFLSTTSAGASIASERSRSSSSSHRLSTTHTHPPACAAAEPELPSVFSPLPSGTGLAFFHPSSIPDLTSTSLPPSSYTTALLATSTASLATALQAPLEKLESKLNPLYPTSRGLGSLVDRVFACDSSGVETCFMLMSSPPTPPEISLARTLSSLLPLFPILVLPPNPSAGSGKRGKRQRTEALVQAVGVQLGRGGVRWVDTGGEEGGRGGEIYLLPHEMFADDDVEEGTGSASNSLSSSQELPPAPPSPALSSLPSTRQSSRSHSNTSLRSASSSSSSANSSSRSAAAEGGAGDLKRLRKLVGSAEGRDRVRRERVDAFLEWREVEVAARGGSVGGGRGEGEGGWERWGEEPWESFGGAGSIRRREERELGFSRRVGERRAELGVARPRAGVEEEDDHAHQQEHDSTSSSLVTDPTTPRCVDRSTLLLPPFSFPSPPPSSSLPSASFSSAQTPLSPSLASSLHSNASAPSALPLAFGADPFHLPSLLHLVGLNIRLALLPVPHSPSSLTSTSTSPSISASPSSPSEKPSSPSHSQHHHPRPTTAGWTAAVLSVGVVFLAGVVVGAGIGAGGAGGGESQGAGVGWAAACSVGRGWRVGRW